MLTMMTFDLGPVCGQGKPETLRKMPLGFIGKLSFKLALLTSTACELSIEEETVLNCICPKCPSKPVAIQKATRPRSAHVKLAQSLWKNLTSQSAPQGASRRSCEEHI